MLQGEERDSSDEEWAAAYTSMDPISQLGWRNRRSGVEGAAEQLLRDVFGAADALHSDAMSEMGVSRHNDEDVANENEVGDNVGWSAQPSGGCCSPTSSMSVDQAGGSVVPNSACLCTHLAARHVVICMESVNACCMPGGFCI